MSHMVNGAQSRAWSCVAEHANRRRRESEVVVAAVALRRHRFARRLMMALLAVCCSLSRRREAEAARAIAMWRRARRLWPRWRSTWCRLERARKRGEAVGRRRRPAEVVHRWRRRAETRGIETSIRALVAAVAPRSRKRVAFATWRRHHAFSVATALRVGTQRFGGWWRMETTAPQRSAVRQRHRVVIVHCWQRWARRWRPLHR